MISLDPAFLAISCYRRRKYDKCIEITSSLLSEKHLDQAMWLLKMKALTEKVYVNDTDVEEESIAEILLDESSIAQIARPGTSLKHVEHSRTDTSLAVRPITQSGRPVTGFLRPGTQSTRPGTMEQALRTGRSGTARPVTVQSGRFVRLGTASMAACEDGSFINISRLNLAKYAGRPTLAKALFEYIFFHENDVKNALELASLASEACQFQDWWWKLQLAKCFASLGMHREAEKQLRSAIKSHDSLDLSLHLVKVFVRLDQPLTAIDVLKKGLEKFPGDTSLLISCARLYELVGNAEQSVAYYKKVLRNNSMSVEAIACIGANYFYKDQPEIALNFFRRLLQMGVHNSQLFNNIGLCCFYSQQYDIAFTCFEKALNCASEDTCADIWFNVGNMAVALGNTGMAYQAFRLALAHDSDHSESFNNLGVLEMKRSRFEQARAFLQAASSLTPHMYEPSFNYAILSEQVGDLQSSYRHVKKSLQNFPAHANSKSLLKELSRHFGTM